ncbi:MAG: hypothetical protein JWN15_1856 [Firmicutes bacterium]|nr:hypothetical protein [Bacillota bacterium]
MPVTAICDFSEGVHAATRPLAGGGLGTAPGATSGEWTSPIYRTSGPFEWAVASWNGRGRSLEVLVRVAMPAGWSPWFSFGTWSADGDRRSCEGQAVTGVGRLSTDTLLLERPARAWQMRIRLSDATVGRAWLCTALPEHRSPEGPDRAAWGVDLPVPRRSQMIYPNGGNVWCSPTALAMVMAYWGHEESIPEQVVPGVYDSAYDGHGNWPFNTAYAGARGFVARVDRFSCFAELERQVAAGFPVIAGVAYERVWLENAPIGQTLGHILVVCGFTPEGDVIVNDPAAPDDAGVRLVYKREQFRQAWLDRGGVVYLVEPENM